MRQYETKMEVVKENRVTIRTIKRQFIIKMTDVIWISLPKQTLWNENVLFIDWWMELSRSDQRMLGLQKL